LAVDATSAQAIQGMNNTPLRFHWRLPYAGETSGFARTDQGTAPEIGLPDPAAQTYFCHRAEECGIDSLLLDFGFAKPDPMLLAATLGQATEKIKFIVAYRSGLFAPTMFVQQLNTLSALIGGRVSLNIVAGYSPEEQRGYGDFLSHDERYARTEEFLAICRALWKREAEVDFSGVYYRIAKGTLKTPFVSSDRSFPEIFVGGGSAQAQRLALSQGTCWMQLADAPETLSQDVSAVRKQGIEAGLRLAVIARPTRDEALRAAYSLTGLSNRDGNLKGESEFIRRTDSVSFKAAYRLGDTEWITPCLWTGAIRSHGSTAIALVGAADEVANALLEYGRVGISQFILSGWPKLEEMIYFGQAVLPIIRAQEAAVVSRGACSTDWADAGRRR
jgi:alkanesulfonate monooxygenase